MSYFFILLASWVIGKPMATVSKTHSGCTLMETMWGKKSGTTTNKSILILKL